MLIEISMESYGDITLEEILGREIVVVSNLYIILVWNLEGSQDLPKDKYFKGSAWVKNACFDEYGKIVWDFDNDYSTNLVKRYNNSKYNFGVPYYRGKTIEAWDTLRSFN